MDVFDTSTSDVQLLADPTNYEVKSAVSTNNRMTSPAEGLYVLIFPLMRSEGIYYIYPCPYRQILSD